MWKFHQVEGFTGELIRKDCETLEELDAAAALTSHQLLHAGASRRCYYKCDIYKNGKRVDGFDLVASGIGVDDCGRTPSQMLRQHQIV